MPYRERPKQEDRRTAPQRGYDYRWTKYARQFRERYPFCFACNLLSRTELVDHIIPVKGQADPLWWPEWNHQPLCRKCHADKTVNHDPRIRMNRKEILRRFDGTRRGLVEACGLPVSRWH